jgi:hypothetical protein
MKIDQREILIRRYLLGELAEADQTALEQELLIDLGKFDQVWPSRMSWLTVTCVARCLGPHVNDLKATTLPPHCIASVWR